jgi:hypothetical protein
MPIGQVAAGPIAVAIGTEQALLVGAGVIAVATIGMFAVPTVRTLERTDLAGGRAAG